MSHIETMSLLYAIRHRRLVAQMNPLKSARTRHAAHHFIAQVSSAQAAAVAHNPESGVSAPPGRVGKMIVFALVATALIVWATPPVARWQE